MTKKLEDLLNIAPDDIKEENTKKAKNAIVEQEDTFRDIADFLKHGYQSN